MTDDRPAVLRRQLAPVAAWLRVATGLVCALVAVAEPSERVALSLFVGLIVVPWAAIVLLGERAGSLPTWFVAIGDLGVLVTLQHEFPRSSRPLLLGFILIAGAYSYRSGRRTALLMTSAWLASTLLAVRFTPVGDAVDFAQLVRYAVLLVLVVLIAAAVDSAQIRQEQRLAHARERAAVVLARVADGIVVTDARGMVTEWNAAASTLFGLDANGPLACGAAMGLHAGTRALDCSSGCALLHTGPRFGGEVWHANKDGRRLPLLASVSAVTGPAGEVVEVVHSVRDITKLKEAEEAKTLFLATASHELKTPLTVIRGYAQTLLLNPAMPQEDRTQALTTVLRRSGELAKIVDRLLLSSRIEAGHVQLAPSAVPVAAIVAERAASLSEATGAAISVQVPATSPLAIGDTDALTTVVDHLLENAIKYSPELTHIEVVVDSDELNVSVSVRDHGVGMDAEQVEHCFDKFWQAERTEVRRFGGTGIGLYIVRSLVDAMSGEVRVGSTLGEGTTFTVVLRRADVPEQRTADEPPAAEPSIIREFMRQLGVPTGTPL